MPRKKAAEKGPQKGVHDEEIEDAVVGAAEEADDSETSAAGLDGMPGEDAFLEQGAGESETAIAGLDGPSEEGVAGDDGGGEYTVEADKNPDITVEEITGRTGPLEGMTEPDDSAVGDAEDDSSPADDQETAALEFHLVNDPILEDTGTDAEGGELLPSGEGAATEDGAPPDEEEAAPEPEDATEGNGRSEGTEERVGTGLRYDSSFGEETAQFEGARPAEDTDAVSAIEGGDEHEEGPNGILEDDAVGDDSLAKLGESDYDNSGSGVAEGDGSAEDPTAPKRRRTKKADDDSAEKAPGRRKATTPAAERTPIVAQAKASLRSQNVRALDRDLTPEEKKEWDAIYASFTSKSILTGVVQGVDMNTFTIRNAEGLLETKKMASAVIISHRVKVLVPELEFSMPDMPLPESVVHHLDQCSIDYVIISVDRENNLAIASRRLAMSARRRYFRTAPRGHERGEELTCRVLSVGPTRCTVECNGYDQEMRASDMGYNFIEDLREMFRPGEELRCRLVDYNARDGLKVSVKEAQRHPFDGAVERHPIGCTRHATITNKDSGSIFCLLSDNVSCVCRYAAQLNDTDFEIGDTVVIVVDSYYLEGKMIRGKILKKW